MMSSVSSAGWQCPLDELVLWQCPQHPQEPTFPQLLDGGAQIGIAKVKMQPQTSGHGGLEGAAALAHRELALAMRDHAAAVREAQFLQAAAGLYQSGLELYEIEPARRRSCEARSVPFDELPEECLRGDASSRAAPWLPSEFGHLRANTAKAAFGELLRKAASETASEASTDAPPHRGEDLRMEWLGICEPLLPIAA